FLNSAIAPVDGNPDRIDGLAVYLERSYALCDHCFGLVFTAGAGDFYHVSALNTFGLGQFMWHFHKCLWHQLHIYRIVLGPIVIVLGEPVGGANHVIALVRRAQFIDVRLKRLRHRIDGLLRMQRISDWALYLFVMLRERPISQTSERSEQSGHAF